MRARTRQAWVPPKAPRERVLGGAPAVRIHVAEGMRPKNAAARGRGRRSGGCRGRRAARRARRRQRSGTAEQWDRCRSGAGPGRYHGRYLQESDGGGRGGSSGGGSSSSGGGSSSSSSSSSSDGGEAMAAEQWDRCRSGAGPGRYQGDTYKRATRREALATPPATKGHKAKWREASAAGGGSGLGKLGCSHVGCTQAVTRVERACPVFGAATGAIFSPILFSF